MRRRLPVQVAGLVATLALLAGCGSTAGDGPPVSGVTTSDHDGYHGVLLPQPYAAPAVTLTDSDDRPFSTSRDTRGRLNVVFFGYTRCPDICQVVMSTIASAYTRLDAADRKRVQVLFVTTDPARDTPAVLRTYLDRLDPHFVGLTGSLTTIDRLGKPLGVFIKKGQKLPSGGYEVDHSTSVIALGGDLEAPLVWSATVSPSQLAADIHKLLATHQV